jgi:hypothetical protein
VAYRSVTLPSDRICDSSCARQLLSFDVGECMINLPPPEVLSVRRTKAIAVQASLPPNASETVYVIAFKCLFMRMESSTVTRTESDSNDMS